MKLKGEKDYIKEKEYEQQTETIQREHPLLMCNNMFEIITKTELDNVIVDELEARQTIFLCAMGILVKNATISSYNLLVNDIAGAGKDYITGKTLSLIPEHLYLKRTRISPTVFTYWHNSKFEPNWNWDGKVLYLEDIGNAILNSSVFKVMCSSGSNATIVKDQRAIDIEIKGKPVIIITSATANPNPELVRRFTIVNLDSGIKQTKSIVKRHLEYAIQGKSPDMDKTITDSLCQLRRVKVKIPFAEQLGKYFPSDNVIMRTHILRFIDYIKASAALHQYQREIDNDEYVMATEQDYQIAKIALLKTTSNQYMIPMTKDQRRIIEVFEKLGDIWVTVQELEAKISFMQERWLREQLDRLVEYGLLEKDSLESDSGKRKIIYKKLPLVICKLPDILE